MIVMLCLFWTPVCQKMVLFIRLVLATAGTAKHTVALLKDWGVTNIKVVCIIACEYGIAKLHEAHPDVEIYAGAIDKTLNDVGYIVPGLGDAGDRQVRLLKINII